MGNPWSNPDMLAPQDARTMALLLEARARTPDQQRLHAAVVAALGPQPGARVLDLGCGTGVIARHLATCVGATGSVLGVDVSATMLAFAQAQDLHPALRFEQGDATALQYDDASFDYAVAARLLMHVPDPHAVLKELRRVVRPGGRLALLERDWGTFAVEHTDRVMTRRIMDWRCDTIDGNNWMGRQLPRLCAESDWQVRTVEPLVSVARDEHATLAGSLHHAARLAQEHNVISAAEHDAWIGELEQRLTQATFFATVNDNLVIAE